MNTPNMSQEQSFKPNWTTLAKIGTATAAAAGLSLHLMGQVTHRVYLHQMGASAGHFPKTTDWLIIKGYYTLADRLIILLSTFIAYLWQILLATIVLGVYIYAVERFGRRLKDKSRGAWLAWSPVWVSDLIRILCTSTFLVVGVPIATIFMMAIFLLPAVLGEAAGKQIAARDLKLFQAACWSEDLRVSPSCSQILMGDRVLATGYIIDTSPTHVAIFDPVAHRTTVMETNGKVIVGSQKSVTENYGNP